MNRSHLSAPFVITDSMPPTEQVDGKLYTSKTAFRAKGRELGLIEVGNEKRKPKAYAPLNTAIRDAFEKAKADHAAGRRPKR